MAIYECEVRISLRHLPYMNVQCVKELTMVQLSVGMATGAAYLGSKVAGHYLPRWAKEVIDVYMNI